MAKVPTIPCAVCGRLRWKSRTSRPAGELICQECRRSRRCVHPECDYRGTVKRGLCPAHYFSSSTCSREGCDRPHAAHGLCARHLPPTGTDHRTDHRCRARQYGAVYEPGLTWQAILAAEGPVCRLCGEDVDPSDKRPSGNGWACGPRYPSLDHVVPFSRGGGHVRSNVQLAHMWCNSAKRDAVPCGAVG